MRRAAFAVLGLLAAMWLACLALVTVESRRDLATTADAIVVLGAAQYNGRPSPVLAARLGHAERLWRRQLAPRLLVTGGVGTGDTLAEAAVSRAWLLQRGVPDSVLTVIAEGRTSESSLRAAARTLPAGARVILVSDGFHMLRLAVIARRLDLEPLGSPARGSPIARSRRNEAAYLLAESVKVPVAFLFTRRS